MFSLLYSDRLNGLPPDTMYLMGFRNFVLWLALLPISNLIAVGWAQVQRKNSESWRSALPDFLIALALAWPQLMPQTLDRLGSSEAPLRVAVEVALMGAAGAHWIIRAGRGMRKLPSV